MWKCAKGGSSTTALGHTSKSLAQAPKFYYPPVCDAWFTILVHIKQKSKRLDGENDMRLVLNSNTPPIV